MSNCKFTGVNYGLDPHLVRCNAPSTHLCPSHLYFADFRLCKKHLQSNGEYRGPDRRHCSQKETPEGEVK